MNHNFIAQKHENFTNFNYYFKFDDSFFLNYSFDYFVLK
jgi:hypothetical protein